MIWILAYVAAVLVLAAVIGRRIGQRDDDAEANERMRRFERWMDRWGSATVLVARAVPLARTAVSLPAGLARFPVRRFLALTTVGSLDQQKLADYIHKTTFNTIVGEVKFGPNGEWAEPRFLFVQYRNVAGNDVSQFRQPGKQVIVYPPQFKSGDFASPYNDLKH